MSGFEDEYKWIAVLGGIIGFMAAFGIGANDLANSFGSSVATKALTMWQCVLIAGVCEFTGAFFLGAGVTDTIKSGIAKTATFQNTPELLLIGMFGVMISGAIWDNLSCHLGLPVSTTHTTVGAIIGMSLVTYGKDAVLWWQLCTKANKYCGAGSKGKQNFPIKGFVPVILSWFVSPIASGLMISVFYFSLRQFVLRSKHSFFRALMILPWLVGFTFGLISAFVIQSGGMNGRWKARSDNDIAWISSAVGGAFVLLTYVIVVPILRKQILSDEAGHNERVAANEKALEEGGKIREGETEEERQTRISSLLADINAANKDVIGEKVGKWLADFRKTSIGNILLNNPLVRLITYGSTYDVHKHGLQDEKVAKIWAHAEVFDFKTERLFRYLQVFSAMVMSFAHGSNDVANAMGPYAAVIYIYHNGTVPKKSPVPNWILVLGGSGIVCGLAIYGYHITRVIGVKAVKLTNTRGFCAELSTAFVVVIASRFGLPISTTQTIIGAVFAVGLFEGVKGVNWKLLYTIFLGWVMTLIIAGFIGAAVQAFAIFTPNKHDSVHIGTVTKEHYFPDMYSMIKQMNSTGDITEALSTQLLGFNKTLTKYAKVPFNFTGLANLQSQVLDVYNSSSCSSGQ